MRNSENIYEAMKYADFWRNGELKLWTSEPKRMEKDDDGVLQALWWDTVIDTEWEKDEAEHIAWFQMVKFFPDHFYFGYWTDMVVWEEGSDPLILEGEDEPYYNRYGMEYCAEEVEFNRGATLVFLRDLLGGRIRRRDRSTMMGWRSWEMASSGSPADRRRAQVLRDPKMLARWVAELGDNYIRNMGSGCDYRDELPPEAWDLI